MKFFNGLHIDNHPSDQPENTYRDGRNIVLKLQQGAVINEEGTVIFSEFPEGYWPIGNVLLADNRLVVFLTDGGENSEIGVVSPSGTYETLANDPRLNFHPDYPIDAVSKLSLSRFSSQQYATEIEVSFSEKTLDITEDTDIDIQSI